MENSSSSNELPENKLISKFNMNDNENGSSSDIEIPAAAINAAIQSVNSDEENEEDSILNKSAQDSPTKQYKSSLLQDFIVKTQLIGGDKVSKKYSSSSSSSDSSSSDSESSSSSSSSSSSASYSSNSNSSSKRNKSDSQNSKKYSKTKSSTPIQKDPEKEKVVVVPSTSTPISKPDPSEQPQKRLQKQIESPKKPALPKASLNSLEKTIYPSERVLYPSRFSKSQKTKSVHSHKEKQDPVWKQIDLNRKFNEPKLSGYKSDGGYSNYAGSTTTDGHTVCSKKLAARRSGYISDYTQAQSGYKTDCSVNSFKSGYKSDCSFKTNIYDSNLHRKKVRRKRRTTQRSLSTHQSSSQNKNKSNLYENELLSLMGLQIDNTNEPNETPKTESSQSGLSSFSVSKTKPSNSLNVLSNSFLFDTMKNRPSSSSSSSQFFRNGCSKSKENDSNNNSNRNVNLFSSFYVSSGTLNRQLLDKKIEMTNQKRPALGVFQFSMNHFDLGNFSFSKVYKGCDQVFGSKLGTTPWGLSSSSNILGQQQQQQQQQQISSSQTTFGSSKSVKPSGRSSKARRMSTMSRCSSVKSATSNQSMKIKPLQKSSSKITEYLLTQIEALSETLKNCSINSHSSKYYLEDGVHVRHKKSSKKKKSSISKNDSPLTILSNSSPSTSSSKRRNKKVTASKTPEDHKLPLKKRHYLMENEKVPVETKNQSNNIAISPKKRHLLESEGSQSSQEVPSLPSSLDIVDSIKSVSVNKKNEVVKRKMKRLEGLVSKIAPKIVEKPSKPQEPKESNKNAKNLPNHSEKTLIHVPATGKYVNNAPSLDIYDKNTAPAGIFEPSVDIELKIPEVLISKSTFSELSPIPVAKSSSELEKVVDCLLNKTGANLIMKKRKRRKAINRTGFPNPKRKKPNVPRSTSSASPAPSSLSMSLIDSKNTTPEKLSKETILKNEIEIQNKKLEALVKEIEKSGKKRKPKEDIPLESRPVKTTRRNNLQAHDIVAPIPLNIQSSIIPKPDEKSTNHKAKVDRRSKAEETRKVEPANSNLLEVTDTPANTTSDFSSSIKDLAPAPDSKTKEKGKKKEKAPKVFQTAPRSLDSPKTVSETSQASTTKKNKNQKQPKSAPLIVENVPENLVDWEDQIPTKTSDVSKKQNHTLSQDKSKKSHNKEEKSKKVPGKLKIVPLPEIPKKLEVPAVPQNNSVLDSSKKLSKKHQKTDKIESSSKKSIENSKTSTEITVPSLLDLPVLPEAPKTQKISEKLLEKFGKTSKKSIESPIPEKTPKVSGKLQKISEKLIQSAEKTVSKKVESVAIPEKSKKPVKEPAGKQKSVEKSIKSGSIAVETPSKPEKSEKKVNKDKSATVEKLKLPSKPKEPEKSKKSLDKPTEKSHDKSKKSSEKLKKHSDKFTKLIKSLNTPETPESSESLQVDITKELAESKNKLKNKKHLKEEKSSHKKRNSIPEIVSETGKKSVKRRKTICAESVESDNEPLISFVKKQVQVPPSTPTPTLSNTPTPTPTPTVDESIVKSKRKSKKIISEELEKAGIYQQIKQNVYHNSVKPKLRKPIECACAPDSGCRENCLNRITFSECSLTLCPSKQNCTNRVIQKQKFVKYVEKFMTEKKGLGIRTRGKIEKDTFIMEYLGEVITEQMFKERMDTIYANDTHHYCLNIDSGLVIDGHRMGSECRFVNHSCNPNCEIQKIYVQGLPRMILVAKRVIQPMEELTYDYKFSLYNPLEGQDCYCGEETCRGKIIREDKRQKPIDYGSDTESNGKKRKRVIRKSPKYSCLLSRSLNTVLQANPNLIPAYDAIQVTPSRVEDPKIGFCFISRRYSPSFKGEVGIVYKSKAIEVAPISSLAKSNSELSKILYGVCDKLEAFKSDKFNVLKEVQIPNDPIPDSCHERISYPITIKGIIENISSNVYETQILLFNYDVKIMIDNVVKFFGINSKQGKLALKLKDYYKEVKKDIKEKLRPLLNNDELLDCFYEIFKTPKNNKKVQEEEDIIQCICGLQRDEGTMIQCTKCLIWQHIQCTKADSSMDKYYCEKCEPRKVDREVSINEKTKEGYQCYLSLMRDDLQVRLGDAVYVLRDIEIQDDQDVGDSEKPKEKGSKKRKHNYKTIGTVNYSECDIFRVEQMWKDENGGRHVYGHHYLRPYETYHEPTRRFYSNELMRVPLYETINIDLIIDTCWVLDPTTYFKGRPMESVEKHVYVCEFKVDKPARSFTRMKPIQRSTVCTKSYAFYKFEEKLKQPRNLLPHAEEIVKKMKANKKKDEVKEDTEKAEEPTKPTKEETFIKKSSHLEKMVKMIREKQKTSKVKSKDKYSSQESKKSQIRKTTDQRRKAKKTKKATKSKVTGTTITAVNKETKQK